MPYPSSVRLIVVWLSALPLVRGCIVERGVMYSQIVFTQILNGGSLCGKSCVDKLVEILLCEGGDVELCARTSKHMLLFAFDPLSPTFSLLHLSIASYCHIIYMLVLFMCLYLCLTKRVLHSSQLLFRGIQRS